MKNSLLEKTPLGQLTCLDVTWNEICFNMFPKKRVHNHFAHVISWHYGNALYIHNSRLELWFVSAFFGGINFDCTRGLFMKKWPLDCQQGSGTLRQQLLMMHGIAGYCMVLHGIALYCISLHGIAWNCMVLHGFACFAWFCMVLHGIAWHCMVLHGIAWYCMVLHGIAWYCMVLVSNFLN